MPFGQAIRLYNAPYFRMRGIFLRVMVQEDVALQRLYIGHFRFEQSNGKLPWRIAQYYTVFFIFCFWTSFA